MILFHNCLNDIKSLQIFKALLYILDLESEVVWIVPIVPLTSRSLQSVFLVTIPSVPTSVAITGNIMLHSFFQLSGKTYEVHTYGHFLLIVHTWNSSPLRTNHLRLQCTCCIVPTTPARPHWSPLVWACQWPMPQPLSSPQLSYNESL